MSDSKNVTPGWFDIVAMVVLVIVLTIAAATVGVDTFDFRVKLKSYPVYSEKRVRCQVVEEPSAEGFSIKCASNQAGIVYLDPDVFDKMPATVKIYQRPRPKIRDGANCDDGKGNVGPCGIIFGRDENGNIKWPVKR